VPPPAFAAARRSRSYSALLLISLPAFLVMLVVVGLVVAWKAREADHAKPAVPRSASSWESAAIDEELNRARARYGSDVEKARATLLLRYDDLLNRGSAARDKQLSARLGEEMRWFLSEGIVFGRDALRPDVMRYGRSLKQARDNWAAAL